MKHTCPACSAEFEIEIRQCTQDDPECCGGNCHEGEPTASLGLDWDGFPKVEVEDPTRAHEMFDLSNLQFQEAALPPQLS